MTTLLYTVKFSGSSVAAIIWIIQFTLAHSLDINACNFQESEPVDNPVGFCFCTPDDVETAEMTKCGFNRLPNENEWRAIAMLRTVTAFDILNRIYTLPKLPPSFVFAGMNSLQSFAVKGASFSEVPYDAFGNSSSITEIDMRINSIRSLAPYAFSNLPNLTVLKLSDNNLTEINRLVFVNLPKLRELWLMQNGILILHDNALRDLNRLIELSLRNNRLSVITRETFSGLSEMKNLDLHGNTLEYIGEYVFADMPNLLDLDLSKNNIKSINSVAFDGLTKLGRLNLRENKLVQLQPHTFDSLKKIYFLDLRKNELETLQQGLFSGIYNNLKNHTMQLLLDGNRFMCDCKLLWIKILHDITESTYVRQQISGVTCNLFERTYKELAAVGPVSSLIVEGDKLATDLQEETTTFAFESEMKVLNLTEKEFNCHDKLHVHEQTSSKSHSIQGTSYETNLHHQKSSTIKGGDNVQAVQTHGHVAPTEWNEKDEFHRDDNRLGSLTSHDLSDSHGRMHHHVSSLNEPQTTAALEGNDVGRTSPKVKLTTDHKNYVSTNSELNPRSSSAGVGVYNCDFSFILGAVILTLMLANIK